MSRKAFVTLLTKTSYLPGALVLDNDLRQVGSKYPLVVMVTPALPQDAKNALHRRGIITREVQLLKLEEGKHALAAHDARFEDTWTKLRGFGLVEYERIVLLDCDMIILKNMDELLEMDLPKDEVAAAHVCACNPRKLAHYPADWIPKNCAHTAVTNPLALPPRATAESPRPYSQLNSGTVVLNPSAELASGVNNFLFTHEKIHEFSFPDQDLLTEYFRGKWRPLNWYYNALKTLRHIHPQEWDDNEVRCLHYILPDKPWHSRQTAPEYAQFEIMNNWWWEHFDRLGDELRETDPLGWKLILANVDTNKM
ncbi:hypothetical protein AX16_009588 [Volvariella volvacea WC 439]|nr:hypothetical protein AX16_009588 [Volvariella volvacea WC 439]